MPTYTYKDTTTGEVFDVILSMKDLDSFQSEFSHYERYFDQVPALVSGVSSSLKTDTGFKEVLSKIAEAHPQSQLADNYLSRSVKQVKTERAVREWRKKSGEVNSL
jgi:hypothetical protein